MKYLKLIWKRLTCNHEYKTVACYECFNGSDSYRYTRRVCSKCGKEVEDIVYMGRGWI